MRNPPWSRDELILALNLYLQAGKLNPNDSRVIELSTLLNRLPIHTIKPDEEKFRNPNSIVLKLANFRALDPNDPRNTKLEDLALVCANCHRMLHKGKPCLNIAELKKIIQKSNN